MPELPEVEHLRRSLEPLILGRRVTRASLLRRDVCESLCAKRAGAVRTRTTPVHLLEGAVITETHRRGKQIAIVARDGRALCVHLGMSGAMEWRRDEDELANIPHVHALWRLEDGWLGFIDPRRFGGLWTYPSFELLRRHRWVGRLGPDALTITGSELMDAVGGTSRSIKSALLDQARVAGIGNIYADESLFRAGIAPERRARDLSTMDADQLAGALRETLNRALLAGGSTLRDYRDARGRSGTAQAAHAVYGRQGQPCVTCGSALASCRVAQRTTVWCTKCQPN